MNYSTWLKAGCPTGTTSRKLDPASVIDSTLTVKESTSLKLTLSPVAVSNSRSNNEATSSSENNWQLDLHASSPLSLDSPRSLLDFSSSHRNQKFTRTFIAGGFKDNSLHKATFEAKMKDIREKKLATKLELRKTKHMQRITKLDKKSKLLQNKKFIHDFHSKPEELQVTQQRAAVQIQRIMRGRLHRKKVVLMRKEIASAKKIPSVARGSISRKQTKKTMKSQNDAISSASNILQHNAAVKIQARIRGKSVTTKFGSPREPKLVQIVNTLSEADHDAANQSATKLQALYRGHKQRKSQRLESHSPEAISSQLGVSRITDGILSEADLKNESTDRTEDASTFVRVGSSWMLTRTPTPGAEETFKQNWVQVEGKGWMLRNLQTPFPIVGPSSRPTTASDFYTNGSSGLLPLGTTALPRSGTSLGIREVKRPHTTVSPSPPRTKHPQSAAAVDWAEKRRHAVSEARRLRKLQGGLLVTAADINFIPHRPGTARKAEAKKAEEDVRRRYLGRNASLLMEHSPRYGPHKAASLASHKPPNDAELSNAEAATSASSRHEFDLSAAGSHILPDLEVGDPLAFHDRSGLAEEFEYSPISSPGKSSAVILPDVDDISLGLHPLLDSLIDETDCMPGMGDFYIPYAKEGEEKESGLDGRIEVEESTHLLRDLVIEADRLDLSETNAEKKQQQHMGVVRLHDWECQCGFFNALAISRCALCGGPRAIN